ncbi:Methyltransferase domain [Micromonospora sediminicola]|uniref:Methyltransferase domain n=1 Tax=Micromonospora sediminicola TaxID=946078 RepID=A0A1A9B5S8_9ACTN|nr:SAM-dependent methyltransferase [Micromonospora sediminicola]SBT64860.1 Methyltransferase domain [Micromonospora sediminicola]
MTAQTHWQAWHEPYADEGSPLSRRLRLVQQHIASWLDQRSDERLTVVSACAGQGHDLIGVLASRPDAQRVHGTLLEYDAGNVAAARAAADQARLSNLVIKQADAGQLSSYVGAVPADLVLMVGVFGNISDADVKRTIAALPRLCAEGASVIWTRARRAPDLTPAVRGWLRDAGYVEEAFHAPDDVRFSVGVHRFEGAPQPLDAAGTVFTFLH